MSERVAEEYIQLLAEDKKAQLALLACSAAYRLNDDIAREAIELVAQSNGSTEKLLRRIKRLGCVLKQDDEFWCVAEDVRPHLAGRLYQQVEEPAALSRLRERLAEHADELASREVAAHRVYQAKFEAAIHRLQIPAPAQEGAQQLAELWQQHYPGPLADATADSIEYLVPEIRRQHPTGLPAEVLFMLGMAARSRGDKRAQENYFGQVYRRGHRGRIYALAAFFYALVVRNWRVAETALKRCIEWDDSVKNQVIAYHELGRLLSRFRSHYKQAEAAYRQSLDIDPDPVSQAQTLHSLGDLLTEQKRWKGAKEAYDKSLALRHDNSHQSTVYSSLGKLFHKQGRWEDAREAYNRSLALLHHNRSHQGRVYHSMGNLLSERHEFWAEAEHYYRLSLSYLDRRADKGQVYHSRGKLFAEQGRWAEAERDFWDSIKLRDNPVYKAYVFHSLGNLLSKVSEKEDTSRWRDAEEAYKQSLELRDHPEDLVHVLASWAKLLSKFATEQDFQRAEEFAKEKIATAVVDDWTKGVYYKFLADIYNAQGKPEQAEEALGSFRSLRKHKRGRESEGSSQTKRKARRRHKRT